MCFNLNSDNLRNLQEVEYHQFPVSDHQHEDVSQSNTSVCVKSNVIFTLLIILKECLCKWALVCI